MGGFGTVAPAKPPRPPGRHRERRRRGGGPGRGALFPQAARSAVEMWKI